MAHAAKTTLVTVERCLDEDFFDDERLVAGVLPSLYVDAIAVVEQGAQPLPLDGEYACRRCRARELCGRTRVGLRLMDKALLINEIADLIGDARHVATGALSPIPAAAAKLAQRPNGGRSRVSAARLTAI